MFERASPTWPTKTKLRVANANAMVSGIFVEPEGGRHCFVLASDTNKKDQKKSSKQTSRLYSETGRLQATNLETQKNQIHQSQTTENHDLLK